MCGVRSCEGDDTAAQEGDENHDDEAPDTKEDELHFVLLLLIDDFCLLQALLGLAELTGQGTNPMLLGRSRVPLMTAGEAHRLRCGVRPRRDSRCEPK